METNNTSNQYDPNAQYSPHGGHDEGSPEQNAYAAYGAAAAAGAQAQDAYAAQAAAYQQQGYAHQGGYAQQGYAQQGYAQGYPQQGYQQQAYPGTQQGMPQGYPGMYPGMQPGMQPGGQPYGAPVAPEQPGGKKEKKPKEKRKRGASFWVALIIIVAALVGGGVFGYFWYMDQQPKPTRAEKAVEGQLAGKSPAEVQAELNRIVEEGMLSISIASVVTFPDGESEGELRIENSPANNYLMNVEITRNDNGEVIYDSGIFGPNTHIQSDKLDVDLPKGQYSCTALFHALDPETEEEIGQAAAEMLIIVGE